MKPRYGVYRYASKFLFDVKVEMPNGKIKRDLVMGEGLCRFEAFRQAREIARGMYPGRTVLIMFDEKCKVPKSCQKDPWMAA